MSVAVERAACRVVARAGARAGDGGNVHFGLAAVRVYDDDQAAAYAASHDLGPDGDAYEEPTDGGLRRA